MLHLKTGSPGLPMASLIWLLLFVPLAGQSSDRFEAGDVNSAGFFPIIPWDPLHGWSYPGTKPPGAGLAEVAACGFNMAGLVFPEDLQQCEKLGLSALLLPPDRMFTNYYFTTAWRTLSDEQIERRVQLMVRAGGQSRALAGYFIMDEPGVQDFPALAKAVAAVKKHAPGKLAYINLFPDYATLGAPDTSQLGASSCTEYLERFVREVRPQVISYDNYMVQYSGDLKDQAKAAGYYRNLLEVRRVALRHKLPYLNIVSANQQLPGMPVPSPANLAFQAYTTLAAGATTEPDLSPGSWSLEGRLLEPGWPTPFVRTLSDLQTTDALLAAVSTQEHNRMMHHLHSAAQEALLHYSPIWEETCLNAQQNCVSATENS
jgi:hypothetical protein